jgi:hypothetical protein
VAYGRLSLIRFKIAGGQEPRKRSESPAHKPFVALPIENKQAKGSHTEADIAGGPWLTDDLTLDTGLTPR